MCVMALFVLDIPDKIQVQDDGITIITDMYCSETHSDPTLVRQRAM